MIMFRNKQKHTDPAQDDLAKTIAAKIIRWQSALAAVLNTRANRLSKSTQKWALLFLCFLATSGLILCLVVPYGSIAVSKPGSIYQSSHIGLPSGQPKPNPLKLTDSLTLKK